MNSEEDLLKFLNALGFEGTGLAREIKEGITLGAPHFNVRHQIAFGEELMMFDLHFKMDHQFKAYRLDRYKATHRSPVEIDHKILNGIDTALLEERMKRENWRDYFGRQEQYQHNIYKDFVADTLAMLNKLSEGQNFDGIKIQEELMFKYWPEERYEHSSKQDMKYLYTHSRDFTPNESGICNVNLAYYIVSGKLDDLHEKIRVLGIEEFPGLDVYRFLEKTLSRNPEDFNIKFSHRTEESIADFIIPVAKVNGDFELDTYEVVLTKFPSLDHAIYNGIDSKAVEEKMRSLDWEGDHSLIIVHDDREPEFSPEVNDVLEKLHLMGQDGQGGIVSDLLQLKYWSDTTMFDGFTSDSAWECFRSLPSVKETFTRDIEVFVAYNLLHGRAVLEQFLVEGTANDAKWARLKPDRSGDEPYLFVEGYSNKAFVQTLALLPIASDNYYQIQSLLKRGGQPEVTLKNGAKVLLEVNPEEKTLNIFTENGRLIPTNIHFNPNWRPAEKKIVYLGESQLHGRKEIPQKHKTFHRKKGKGRGL